MRWLVFAPIAFTLSCGLAACGPAMAPRGALVPGAEPGNRTQLPMVKSLVTRPTMHRNDVTTTVASVNYPTGIAFDSSGDIYVADYADSAVKKIKTDGTVVTIHQGSQTNDPYSVGLDSNGNLFIAAWDDENSGDGELQERTASGTFSTLRDRMNEPSGIALNESGTVLYTCNQLEAHCVSITSPFTGSATNVTTVLDQPNDIALDGSGNIYATVTESNEIVEVKNGVTSTLISDVYFPRGVAADAYGNVYFTTIKGTCVYERYTDGTIVERGAGFYIPNDLKVDSDGDIFVADTGHNAVKLIVSTGTTQTVNSDFRTPTSVAVGKKNFYVADPAANAVDRVSSKGIITKKFMGFSRPFGVAVDDNGTAYVSDTGHGTIKRIDATGAVSTFATGFKIPLGVAIAPNGDLYVADAGLRSIFRIDANGNKVRVAKGFALPYSVAVDERQNVYVGDVGAHTVYRVTPTGTTSVLGSGFRLPYGLSVHAGGILFVADAFRNAVFRVTHAGAKITAIGSGFRRPFGVAVASGGKVFIADTGNHALKEFVP